MVQPLFILFEVSIFFKVSVMLEVDFNCSLVGLRFIAEASQRTAFIVLCLAAGVLALVTYCLISSVNL